MKSKKRQFQMEIGQICNIMSCIIFPCMVSKNPKVLHLLGSPCPTLDESPMLDSSLQPKIALDISRQNGENKFEQLTALELDGAILNVVGEPVELHIADHHRLQPVVELHLNSST